MSPVPATALYAALLTLLYLLLSFRVVARRRGARVAIGTGGDRALERAARVHANLAEYAPPALLLLLLAELSGYPAWLLHVAGASLVAGRLVHALGVSREPEDLRFRTAGMAATFGVLGALALLLLLGAAAEGVGQKAEAGRRPARSGSSPASHAWLTSARTFRTLARGALRSVNMPGSVGVREARARSAELVDRAERGETVVITRGDREMARLGPPARREQRGPGG